MFKGFNSPERDASVELIISEAPSSSVIVLPFTFSNDHWTDSNQISYLSFRHVRTNGLARVSNHFTDFNARNKILMAKRLQQGNKLRKAVSKFYHRHFELVSKYNTGLRSL